MKDREHMTNSRRAKQFMPFSALSGLEEALRAAEERNARRFSHGERNTCMIHTDFPSSDQIHQEDPPDTHTSGPS